MFLSLWAAVTTFLVPLPLLLLLSFGMTAQLPMKSLFWLRTRQVQASPGEFPWTCLVLNQNNDFIGSCAVIPNDSSNNNGRGTRKVVTAAHKLKNIQQNELLKIRVGEYDASGFNPPETVQHEEYTVVRLLKHPQFNAGRLSNDIALLYTDRDINLNKT